MTKRHLIHKNWDSCCCVLLSSDGKVSITLIELLVHTVRVVRRWSRQSTQHNILHIKANSQCDSERMTPHCFLKSALSSSIQPYNTVNKLLFNSHQKSTLSLSLGFGSGQIWSSVIARSMVWPTFFGVGKYCTQRHKLLIRKQHRYQSRYRTD